jgi:hypothetical protein
MFIEGLLNCMPGSALRPGCIVSIVKMYSSQLKDTFKNQVPMTRKEFKNQFVSKKIQK